MFLPRGRWQRQPTGPVRVDLGNRLASGTLGVIAGTAPTEVLTGMGLSGINGAKLGAVGFHGAGLAVRGSQASYYMRAPRVPPGAEATIMWLGTFYGAPSASVALGGITYDSANTAPYVCCEIKANPGANQLFLQYSTGGSFFNVVGGNYSAGRQLLIARVRNGAQDLWQNGTSVAGAGGAVAALQSTSTARLEVGDSLNARAPDADCALLWVWGRYLADAEVAELNRNPWQMFRADRAPAFYSLPGGDQTITVSDSGAASDSITIGAALALTDSGAGTDALSIAAALALADSGAGTDGAPSVTVTVTLTDTGTGTETFAGSATIALTDSGGGSDALSILTATLVSIADSATGSDAVAITVSLSLADTGAGTDAFSGAAQLALTDSGSGADSLGVVSDILKTVADVASGTDAVSIAVQVVVPDTGTGLETLGITAALAVLDSGTGYDVVITTAPGGAKIVTITFRASGRRVAFSASARSINFTMH